jgi:hypothetical protein
VKDDAFKKSSNDGGDADETVGVGLSLVETMTFVQGDGFCTAPILGKIREAKREIEKKTEIVKE